MKLKVGRKSGVHLDLWLLMTFQNFFTLEGFISLRKVLGRRVFCLTGWWIVLTD